MDEFKDAKDLINNALSKSDVEFTMASVDEVDEVDDLKKYIDILLEAIGHPEALVTDESQLYDFFDIFEEYAVKCERAKELSKELGVEIKNTHDLIIDIAKRMKNNVEG